jgi:hypothetical protein
VGLANLGSELETCVGSRVHLVGVAISFEKNFYRLSFTPPSLVRRIGPSLHPSSIRPFLIFRPRHHVFPNVSFSKRKSALLPNDGVLPTAGIFTECFEENFLLNGVFLPNSAHRSVSFLYQFLVLTVGRQQRHRAGCGEAVSLYRWGQGACLGTSLPYRRRGRSRSRG